MYGSSIDEAMIDATIDEYAAGKPVLVFFMYLTPTGKRDCWVAYNTVTRDVVVEAETLSYVKGYLKALNYAPSDVRIVTGMSDTLSGN